ncbi:MAG TPA: amino acid adenylation domain-containing protein, partial [Longimicrobiaceae bacterium]|nr:amino acid adenylation domain-containing protein [Longimicrobiaceae bacterium]
GGRGPLATVDLSGLAGVARTGALEAAAGQAQRSLELARGPLLRMGWFDMGAGDPGRLLAVVHHLAVDGVSWRVLLEDLETAYAQLRRGEGIRLPAKTASWKAWAERLAEHARSGALEAESAFWLAQGRQGVAPLPLDDAAGENILARGRSVEVRLSEEETEALLREVPAAYRTRVDEVLLCALAGALRRWTGERRVRIGLEGHGREEEVVGGVDLSRTVGWFTAAYPVVLELPESPEPGAALKAVKEQLRAVPGRGIGYGLLRYLGGSEAAAEMGGAGEAEVGFNYLGQFDQTVSGEAFFAFAPESAGAPADGGAPRPHRLEVSGSVQDGRLELQIGYAAGVHRSETIECLAEWYAEELRGLIAHCRSPEAGGYTPGDFPLAGLDQAALDALLGSGRGVEDVYPLSPLQEGMLFHALYAPGSGVYVGQFGFVLEGPLDAQALERAWRGAVARHEALRAGFVWEGLPRPVQVVRREATPPFRREDWRGLDDAERQARLERYLEADRAAGIDPGRAPLMRLALFRMGDEEHQLVWTHHHLVLDGWSLSLLFRDVLTIYGADTRGERAELKVAGRFRDYLAWLQRQDLARAEDFWRAHLAGFTSPTPLPLRHAAPGAGVERAGEAWLRLPPERTRALREQAWKREVTLSTLVQGAWGLLLSRYAGEEDVLFGATVAGRPAELPGVEEMVGLFINTLPVRVWAGGADGVTLGGWLRTLQEEQLRTREHEYSPLVQVQQWSELPAGEALFESLVVFENYPMDEGVGDALPGLRVRGNLSVEHTNYPLLLTAVPGERLTLQLRYDRGRAGAESVERMMEHLDAVLETMAADPDRLLDEVSLLRGAERVQVLEAWNATAAALPRACVHELFAEQVERTPHASALVCGGEPVSYAELAGRAARLAHHLRRLGVGPEARVALCLERGPDLVAGMLAVLHAGAAYVPIDEHAPPERVREILADAGCLQLLTHAAWTGALPERLPTGAGPLRLDDPAVAAAIACLPGTPPAVAGDPEQLAYVIYTSGSTGRPKGVAVPHRAVVRLVRGGGFFPFGPDERIAQVSNPAFDAVTFEVWGALLHGAALVLFPAGPLSLEELGATIREREVTTLWLTAGLFHRMVDENLEGLSGLRQLLAGGDVLSPAHVRRVREAHPALRLINGYGPTENTTFTCCHTVAEPVAAGAPVPIGRPVGNTRVYVVDAHGAPAGVGLPGELYAGGAGVARGYLGDAARTAERFVPDSYSGEAGARLYRTGDRVRWRAEGVLDFLGRTDAQVKVRGFRVEPGEIEAALREQAGVREAVVVAREDAPGEKRLAAYLVAEEGGEVPVEEVKRGLRERLPEYMMPAAYVVLEALPLTPNGKLDRGALPAPEAGGEESVYEAPRTAVEELVAGIW